jgi:hypothetical protein
VSRIRFTKLAALCVLLTGCYTLEPVRGATPALGAKIAFDVNDAGRFALGSQVGPETGQIEGRLIQRDNGEYLLGVTAVRPLRGGEQVWKGEPVRIKPEYVGNMYERRFNAVRSVLLGAAVAAGIGAIVSQDLLGTGQEDGPTTPTDTGATQRSPRGFRIPIWSVPVRFPSLGRP